MAIFTTVHVGALSAPAEWLFRRFFISNQKLPWGETWRLICATRATSDDQ
jgi:hypothetical protein